MEALSELSDAVMVSNTFLQDRFGGEITPHVRDTEAFDPDRFDGRAARVEHGIPTDSTVVMFSGTPRPHKGVEELLKAVSACPEDVVGVTYKEYPVRWRRISTRSLPPRTTASCSANITECGTTSTASIPN